MIEANCVACGTLNRIAEGDVPAGAKFVTCTSCKSRVALPAAKTTQLPTPPALPKIGGIPAIPKAPPAVPKVPAPVKTAATAAAELADLPAPKRQSPLAEAAKPATKPAPRSGLSAALDEDLPAPRAKSAAIDLDDLLAPAPKTAGMSDLPAPRAAAAIDISDLPAPKPRLPAADLPAPKSRPTPLPKALEAEGADLPAPKTRATPPSGVPATPPRPGGARALTDFDFATPAKTAEPAGDLELELPSVGSGDLELDLPAPAAGDVAPKGFFDDLPQPAAAKPGDVAPKGFFDDLPQPAAAKPASDVAPKGFFDDLPQPSRAPKPAGDVAPKGFFDDLPQPAADGDASEALSLDLGEAGAEPAPAAPAPSAGGGAFDALDLGGTSMPSLELEPPSDPPTKPSTTFDDLDLGAPSVGPAAKTPAPPPRDDGETGIKFGTPKPKPPGAKDKPLPSLASKANLDLSLELEEPRDKPKAAPRPEKSKQAAEDRAKQAVASQKKRKLIAGAALGVVLLGGGGFFLYKRHVAAQEVADKISGQLASARKALASDDDNRWTRAGMAASKVLELDAKNGEALGIGAEAAIAGAFADGKNQPARFAKGRKLITDALATGHTSPALERAQALSTLTTKPAEAATKIQTLLQRTPTDASLQLYLGWALEAAGDLPGALKAYDAATKAPAVKVLALLGRGRVKLTQADVDGAKADFEAILALDEKHREYIPAQVGLAATMPSSMADKQEDTLVALLKRKDIDTADQRAVRRAWVLAGDIARKAGRFDAARERYRKALALDDKDLAARSGLAEVELRDGKLAVAGEELTKVLTQSPDDANAQLIATELAIAQKLYDEAGQRLDALSKRTLPPLDQARLLVVTGKLHDAKGEDDAAADSYVEAAKLAGERDLAPTMLAVAKLSQLAAAATATPDRAAALRQRADQLLTAFAAAAEQDPSIALALGTSYTQAGDPAKGEEWLRKVLAARPKDAGVMYQLGKALAAQGKHDEAVKMLLDAIAAAPGRLEISLELARTYAALGKNSEAEAVYDKLVAATDASVEARGRAGRFYARLGKLDKAGAQGEQILLADPAAAVGHFLKGEGLIAAKQLEAARHEMSEAVSAERDPQFLDGQGRATEQLAMPVGSPADLALQEAALRAYQAAHELDPKMLNPLVGMGRIYVAQRASKAAVPVLLDASKLKPNDPEITFLLGVAYDGVGEKKNAKLWLEAANRLEPHAQAYWLLAKIYETVDDSPRAAAVAYGEAYQRARDDETKRGLPRPPWYLDALYFHGRFSSDTQNYSAAKKAFEEFMGANPPAGPHRDDAAQQLATKLKGV